MNRKKGSELLNKYALGNLAIETGDAHSALSIFRGAKTEGFKLTSARIDPTLYLPNIQPRHVHGKNCSRNGQSIDLLKKFKSSHRARLIDWGMYNAQKVT